jgi:hypothetical protein
LVRAPWKFLLKNFVALNDELLKRRMIHDFAPILPGPGIIVDTKYVIRYWPDVGTCGKRVGLDSPQEHNNYWLQLLCPAGFCAHCVGGLDFSLNFLSMRSRRRP